MIKEKYNKNRELTDSDEEVVHYYDPDDNYISYCGIDLSNHRENESGEEVNCKTCLDIDKIYDSWYRS